MIFIVRQTTSRAGGGQIVRTKRIEKPEITIGRDDASDIDLIDLGVALNHAVVRYLGPGRVEVESLDHAGFMEHGRTVGRETLSLARAPRLRFGDHVLTFTTGEHVDEVVIEVALGVEARASVFGPDDRAVFRPDSGVIGRRGLSWALAVGVLALCLALPIVLFVLGQPRKLSADAQWSSGPLSQAHAFLEGDCQACHQQAFVSVRDTSCQTCHAAGRPASEIQRVATTVAAAGSAEHPSLVFDHAGKARLNRSKPPPDGLGAQLIDAVQQRFNRPTDRCVTCHVEHIGPERVALPRERDAVERNPAPTLAATETCVDCHSEMRTRLPDTPLLNTPNWSAHPDFRPLLTVSADGARPVVRRIPLAQRPRDGSGLTFPHDVHLLPTGLVARTGQVLGRERGYGGALGCANCHRADGSGEGFQPVIMERDCGACHSLAYARGPDGRLRMLPHGEPDVVVQTLAAHFGRPAAAPVRQRPGVGDEARRRRERADAGTVTSAEVAGLVRAAFAPGGTCSDCHTVRAPSDGSLRFDVGGVHLVDRYLPRGAFDHDVPEHRIRPDGSQACGDCHAATASGTASDVLLPRIDRCATCHGAQPAATPHAAPGTCETCHSFHAPARPTRRPPLTLAWAAGP